MQDNRNLQTVTGMPAGQAFGDGEKSAGPAEGPGTGVPERPSEDPAGTTGKGRGRLHLAVPVCVLPAMLLGGAHLWRAGLAGLAVACVLWGLCTLLRRAWMRLATALVLLLLAAEWFVATGRFLQMRLLLQEPWLRLVLILCAVAGFTLVTALLVWERPGRQWFDRGRESAGAQFAGFALVLALLASLLVRSPGLLLAERLLPGFGAIQVLAAALWGAMVCGQLLQRDRAGRVRLFVWRLFSLVFFVQFALAAAGIGLLYMGGQPHIPVPGVILAGAVYRAAPGFMLLLFTVSVLLVGSAWCSHLCYFGSWDAAAASGRKPDRLAHPLLWRCLSLGVVCGGALILRLAEAPVSLAVAGGIALGLLLLPAALVWSRRRGYAVYCTTLCPLGLLACLGGRLSPWRIRRTDRCTMCLACTRVCRYGAMTREGLGKGGPGLSCTLCRDCLAACRHDGLALRLAGLGGGGRAERAFVILVSAMHATFLFIAMV